MWRACCTREKRCLGCWTKSTHVVHELAYGSEDIDAKLCIGVKAAILPFISDVTDGKVVPDGGCFCTLRSRNAARGMVLPMMEDRCLAVRGIGCVVDRVGIREAKRGGQESIFGEDGDCRVQ